MMSSQFHSLRLGDMALTSPSCNQSRLLSCHRAQSGRNAIHHARDPGDVASRDRPLSDRHHDKQTINPPPYRTTARRRILKPRFFLCVFLSAALAYFVSVDMATDYRCAVSGITPAEALLVHDARSAHDSRVGG